MVITPATLTTLAVVYFGFTYYNLHGRPSNIDWCEKNDEDAKFFAEQITTVERLLLKQKL